MQKNEQELSLKVVHVNLKTKTTHQGEFSTSAANGPAPTNKFGIF